MEWALIIPKTLSAGIDFHFLRLCNGSCNTADPKSRYLVISLHGSRRDELKIARHWPWTWRRSEKWQRGMLCGRLLCGRGSTRGQSSTRDRSWSSWARTHNLFSPPPPFFLPLFIFFFLNFFPLKIWEMLARRAAVSKTSAFPLSAARKRNYSKGCSILKLFKLNALLGSFLSSSRIPPPRCFPNV